MPVHGDAGALRTAPARNDSVTLEFALPCTLSIMAHSPDPIPALKRRVAEEILLLVDGWTQGNAGALLRAAQPRVSELRAGRLDRYSLDRLLRFIASLGRGIEIVTTQSRPSVLDHSCIDKSPAPSFSSRAAHAASAAQVVRTAGAQVARATGADV